MRAGQPVVFGANGATEGRTIVCARNLGRRGVRCLFRRLFLLLIVLKRSGPIYPPPIIGSDFRFSLFVFCVDNFLKR